MDDIENVPSDLPSRDTSIFVCPNCARQNPIDVNATSTICISCNRSFGFYACPSCEAPQAIQMDRKSTCRRCSKMLRADSGIPSIAFRELVGRDSSAPGIIASPDLKLEPFLIVTTNDIPGYEIETVYGDVFGLTVRARNTFSNFGAHFRTVVGGEVAGYTKLLTDSRNEARRRLTEEARSLGANSVVAMRFDCNEIGEIMTETAAYGTAVFAIKSGVSVASSAEMPSDLIG